MGLRREDDGGYHRQGTSDLAHGSSLGRIEERLGSSRRIVAPAEPECQAKPRPRIGSPVGAIDSSPPIYRWVRQRRKWQSPVGTTEPYCTAWLCRPYGTPDG